MMVQTNLTPDHPVSKLCQELNAAALAAQVPHDVVMSALLSLFVMVAKRHRCCAVSSLHQLHHAAEQIAAVHFPEMQFEPVSPAASRAH